MAIYVPTARRRRNTALIAGAALLFGVAFGFSAARSTTASVEAKVASVRKEARETSGGLRVLALHAQANVGGTADVRPVLARTRAGLTSEFATAPWIGSVTRKALLSRLDALTATAPESPAFATGLTGLADEIDRSFGVI